MWTTLWDTNYWMLQWGVVIGASTVAAIWDASSRKIPNILTGPLLLSGLVWASCIGGFAGIGESFVACIVMAGPYIFLFLTAGGGAGDAKMMGAIGAWLGLINGLVALVCVSMAGVILGVIFLVRRRGLSSLKPALTLGLIWVFSILDRRKQEPSEKSKPLARMPYGLAILTGVCLAVIGVELWKAYAYK